MATADEGSRLTISTHFFTKLTRIPKVDTFFKWLTVILIWTAVVYGFLIHYISGLYFHTFIVSSEPKDADGSSRILLRHNSHRSPVQHVYYLKTHKTGSTTIYSILAEYCRSHDLLPLLPVHMHINLKAPFSPTQVILHPTISHYDMVFNHHVYDVDIFKYLHNDTFKFTTLREPFSHFVSSFHYFKYTDIFPYLHRINTSHPMETFLANHHKYETKGYDSFTNNRQSMDLGYNLTFSFNNLSYINSFIADTEKRFHLVLITSYFHESLILLKRTLRWYTKDIIYYRKLSTNTTLNVSKDLLDLYTREHRNFSTADIELYNHFLRLFKERISTERDLVGEVDEFEAVLDQVHHFCDNNQTPQEKTLVVPSGRWSDEIIITYFKCRWLKLDEIPFTEHLKNVRKYQIEHRKNKHNV